ncbi:putative RNA methyltransferase [Bhargavaea ullalensis]|uniref:23S rRNA (Guanine745-N1)-methyltransferase n=1 Tax=Bhargavaea ullalensis TaxID=1265685 RepID=A0ABV2G9N5_9BACL
MNKQTRGALRLSEIADSLRCPICGSPVSVDGRPALICTEHHSFDIAKQGYVNMLSRSPAAVYSKELFEARRRIITGSGMYAPLHRVLAEELPAPSGEGDCVIADLGSGEGSHLDQVLRLAGTGLKGVGLDIAKEGVRLAARDYEDIAWVVGDLAASPFAGGKTDVILNILSPSNYSEFKRMLRPGGKLIKVIPATGYLKEIREAVHGDDERSEYSNEQTVSLFGRNFHCVKKIPIRHEAKLERAMLNDLIQMTPLGWTNDRNKVELFLGRELPAITVELDILIGTAK